MLLNETDLQYVITQLPKDIRQLLTEHSGKLFVGGGFIRATVAGEEPSDIDLFGSDKAALDSIATILKSRRDGSRLHRTKNAITLITPNRMAVQFITRWTFNSGADLVASFDFSVCQAAVWRNGSGWASEIGERFYIDLVAIWENELRLEVNAGRNLQRFLIACLEPYAVINTEKQAQDFLTKYSRGGVPKANNPLGPCWLYKSDD
jgi:hypothetical protein